MTFGLYIFALSLVLALLQALKYWALTNPTRESLRLGYMLTISNGLIILILEGSMVYRYPDQAGILLFFPVYLWMLVMGIRGLKGLK